MARFRSRCAHTLLIALPLLSCVSCATSRPLELAREQLRGGDAEAALATLAEAEVPRRDRLLLLLDRGLAAQGAGRYRESIAALAEAAELIERLDFLSVSEQGASLVVNDRVASYRGESAERLWVHTFQMLNYLALDEFEGAAVEARRALVVLDDHAETLAADPVTRLLVAMSFEAAGQIEAASVEYRKLVTAIGDTEGAAEGLAGTATDGIVRAAWLNARRTARPDEAERLASLLPDGVLAGARRELDERAGELVVVLAGGFVPPKHPGDLFISPELRISFPYYAESFGDAAPVLEALVDGERIGTVTVTTTLVDVARAALAERGKRIAARQTARAVTKYNLAHAAGRENEFAGQLLRALFFVLEQADTRSWESLPATLSLVQIPLPAGRHDVELHVRDGARRYRATLADTPVRAHRRTFRSVRPGLGGSLHYAARPD